MASVQRDLANSIADTLVECTNQDTLRWLLNIESHKLSSHETSIVQNLLRRASVLSKMARDSRPYM